jgi:hypothetical protein
MSAELAAEVAIALLLLVLLPLLAIGGRRRLLQRRGGTVDMSLRLRSSPHGRGWALGVGRFEGDCLEWYRVFSLAPRPRRRINRRGLQVIRQRAPTGPETYALLKGARVMECATAQGPVELAMEPSAVTGFLAWLESQPPGATLPRG